MQKVAEHLQQRPELLPTLLTSLFEIVLFEDCPQSVEPQPAHAKPHPHQRAGQHLNMHCP